MTETKRKRGRPLTIGAAPGEFVGVRLDPELRDRAKAYAKEHEMTLSAVIRAAIQEYMKP